MSDTVQDFADLLTFGELKNSSTDTLIVAEDVYEKLRNDLTTFSGAAPSGTIASLYGVQITVSKLLEPGTVFRVPSKGLGFNMPMQPIIDFTKKLGPVTKSLKDMTQVMAAASKSIQKGLEPPPLEAPFADIEFINAETGEAFDADRNYLLTLDPKGIVFMARAYNKRVISSDGQNEVVVTEGLLGVTPV